MIPVLFSIGPIPINAFGLMMVCAFFAAWRLLWLNLRRAGEPVELAEDMVMYAAIGGIAGARIDYLLSFPEEFMRDPLGAAFGGAGFVFYGGLIGGFLAVWIFLRIKGKPFLPYADLTCPVLALGYAVGRIGCHLSGDGDYGIPSNLPWAVSYSLGVVPTPPGVRVHPTPVYETLAAFAVTALLLSLLFRHSFKKPGQLFGLYFILSAICRFLVEFIRIEPVVAWGLTQAQLAAIGCSLFGLVLMSGVLSPKTTASPAQ